MANISAAISCARFSCNPGNRRLYSAKCVFFTHLILCIDRYFKVWQLADFTRDGKLDKLEFCIAMKLLRNVCAGIPLPPMLPESLKHVAPPLPQPLMRPLAYGAPQLAQQTYAAPQQQQQQPPPPFEMGTKENYDWTIPQPWKLRYSQRFNQFDKQRQDYLTGQQVGGAL